MLLTKPHACFDLCTGFAVTAVSFFAGAQHKILRTRAASWLPRSNSVSPWAPQHFSWIIYMHGVLRVRVCMHVHVFMHGMLRVRVCMHVCIYV